MLHEAIYKDLLAACLTPRREPAVNWPFFAFGKVDVVNHWHKSYCECHCTKLEVLLNFAIYLCL